MYNINYIIATYSGIIDKRVEYESMVLQMQLKNITHIIKYKKYHKIYNNIKYITVVCPKARGISYPNYYQKEKWIKIYEYLDTELKFIDHKGENKNHSYDQWLEGYLEHPNCDYHLLMEDDYCINFRNYTFDNDIIKLYQQKFKNNIGYLTTMVDKLSWTFLHAAISNGLISRETFETIGNKKDILNIFYKNPNNYPDQIRFSLMFTDINIPLKDIRPEYTSYFWASHNKKLVSYNKGDTKETIFAPIQMENFIFK
jgi:hypothetical protein